MLLTYIVSEDEGTTVGLGCAGLPEAPVEGFNPLVWTHDVEADAWTFSCLDQETGWSLSGSLVGPNRPWGQCASPDEPLPYALVPSVEFAEEEFRFADSRQELVLDGSGRLYCRSESVVFGLNFSWESDADTGVPFYQLSGELWLWPDQP